MTPKVKHHFVESATAFLDTIGFEHHRITDQYQAARFWTASQEKIVQQIAEFSHGKSRIYAGYIRMFGILSETARYLSELNATEKQLKRKHFLINK
jgi:hypothetical protein